MMKEAIISLTEGKDLSCARMGKIFSMIMSASAQPAQVAAFLTALRIKGETVDEITAAARVMRKFAVKIDVRSCVDMDRDEINVEEETVLDTCGTGGTGTNTFNISTTSAFVVSACGIKVAKHGNRSASSACGSADVLDKLGIRLDLKPAQVKECIRRIGIGFMYAPVFHRAMKHALPVRKAIGIRTIFNLLGPLCNPAGATCQLLGVYDRSLTRIIANVLCKLGSKRAFVVHGLDTLDEISITGPTQVSELNSGKVRTYMIEPEQFGMKRARLKSIEGGDAGQNAKIILSVLSGARGPRRDIVLLNAAYALVAARAQKDVRKAVSAAAQSIDSGRAMDKLRQLKDFARL
ncbi:MAG: anthranilate phosphoribosyltransferase [Candidatus Omnitrophica bacterium]|nr:anthranilate phosphoribosyltransferase [Candidatus Omnitrophota bacterium]